MWKAAKWGLASLVVALAIALAGVGGYTVGDSGGGSSVGGPPASTTTTAPASGFGILDEIYRILEEDFVNPEAVTPEIMQKGGIDGVIAALGDPHTVYIRPEDYALGIDLVTGSFEGIGAQVDLSPVTGEIVIVAPFRESPAEKAGIQPGDVLLGVDGESTEGWSVADAVQRIRGPQGSSVTIKVRHADKNEVEVTIVRSTIVIPTVFTRDIQDESGKIVSDLAYIELGQFTDQTVDDLRKELVRIKDAGNYKGIILDVRRNPGGGLDATVAVADMFLDGGVVLTQVDREGNETVYSAKSGGEATDLPIVILAGKGSASGSEVLAGALRDHGRAKLIGEQTFGKGSVNHLRELSNGGALYVTIARWLTPNGEQIEGVGLKPDIAVAPTEQENQTGDGPQLYAAINYLHGNVTQAQQ
ncbi:MAG: S41 family peptidase [Dehalococcoidia bacterium]|nr:S41 family peptidase [Dehalococcoidia bacterium]